MKCSVCSAVDETTREAHKHDNACDTDCNVCGQVRTITHDYSVLGKNNSGHWMKCFVCGEIDETTRKTHVYDNACDTTCDECSYVRTITHDYSVQDKNAETHWLKCSVCGVVDETTREPHGFDNGCDTTCDECGYTRTITHDYSVQDKNETEHWAKCSICETVDESSRESHSYDNSCDTTCDECSYVRTIVHDYSDLERSETEHWLKCSVCGTIDETTRETHGYDNDCDTTCDECGYIREIIHDYSEQEQSNTEHWLKCSICGVVDENTRETHDFDHACDTTCDECGYVRTITHDYSVQDKSNTEHWMECSVCGEIDETTRKTHGYDNACDTTCDECGYIREITHDYSAQDENAETHWMKCSICGTIDEATREAHGYDNACDSTCNECGAERQVPDHIYDDAKDLVCNECGFERPPYIPGDVDNDGDVDLDDAIYLLYHVNFSATYPVSQPIDFNGDGEEDLDDAIYLLYHVNFKDTYPLH